jgi:tetratricopeptide (TPR) repeat protein
MDSGNTKEDPPPPQTVLEADTRSPLSRLFSELKSRRVFRIAGGYVISFWIIIQVMASTFGGFNVPDSVFRMVVVLLLVAFPFVMGIAWLAELGSGWRRKPTLILTISGLLVLLAIGLGYSQPWAKVEASEISAAEVSEEMTKVRNILEGLSAIPEDYALAEHIMDVVLAADPLNVKAITLMARVHVTYLYRGFDTSDERNRKARQFSERAFNLAPNDPEAQALLGIFYLRAYRDAPRAFELLDQAAKAAPDDAFIWRFRADALRRSPGIDQSLIIETLESNVRRFPHDPLSAYDLARFYRDISEFEKMETWMDRTLEIFPLPNAMYYKALSRFAFEGELAPLGSLSESIPARWRSNERYLFYDWVYAMAANNPEFGLRSLRRTTSDWFRDFVYTGPRALLEAQLHEVAGRPELARVHYQRALDLINQNTDTTENFRSYSVKTWILIGLRRFDEARASHSLMKEALVRPYRFDPGGVGLDWFDPILVSLLIDDRETAHSLIRESLGLVEASEDHELAYFYNRKILKIHLRLDPRLKPWQNDEDLLALIAKP